jgi:Xaa-Pro aminopeptidase
VLVDADSVAVGSDRPGGACAVRAVDDPAAAAAQVTHETVGDDAGTVIAPRGVRHDTALFLERAGFDVASTGVVAEARTVKTPAERTALRALGRTTAEAFDRVSDLLAEARVDPDGTLRVDAADPDGAHHGDPGEFGETPMPGGRLTVTRLRRAVAVELARGGVDAGTVGIHGTVEGTVVAGRPLVIESRPRSPDGSRLRAARTVVVEGEGGWERRAYVALEAACRAGRDRLATVLDGETETASGVAREVGAELTAYGFDGATVAVHGVGLSAVEAPRDDDQVEAGGAVAIVARVTRDTDGTASTDRGADAVGGAETLLLDAEEGLERLVSLPGSLSPARERRR